jgi:hypothetical protein
LTEEEYLSLTRPGRAAQLFYSRKSPLRTTPRKARLFACACCRRVWDYLGEAGRAAVEAAERAADGLMRIKDLRPFQTACPLHFDVGGVRPRNPARLAALPGAWVHAANAALAAATVFARCADVAVDRWLAADAEGLIQCGLLRDILGNPFRRRPDAPLTTTETARRLALSIYESRTFADLPILADALEDAGCTDAELLGHLRGPGPHVRGCWVLDVILGKR